MFHSFSIHCSSLFLDKTKLLSIVPYTTGNYKGHYSYYSHYKYIQRGTFMPPLANIQNFMSVPSEIVFLFKERDEGGKEGERKETSKEGGQA